jgi:hypothetical protein
MSKLTLGIATGAAVLVAAAVPTLASFGSSDTTLKAASAGTHAATSSNAVVNAGAVGARSVTAGKPLTARTATGGGPVTLLTPFPTGLVPSPDPRSAACRTHPGTEFCTVDSVRYVMTGTTATAHTAWLAVLAKWGLSAVTDSCVDQPAQAGEMCVVRGTHGTSAVTVLFKKLYDARYAPAAVKAQADAVHQQAMAAVVKAATPAQQAKILKAAAMQATALQKTADAYNAKHLKVTVNVVVKA